MTKRTDTRQIAGNPKLFLEDIGYDIQEDSDQPGLWVWTAPTDSCESSFHTAKEALESAWTDAVSQTMAISSLSIVAWDALSFEQQKQSIIEALSDEDS